MADTATQKDVVNEAGVSEQMLTDLAAYLDTPEELPEKPKDQAAVDEDEPAVENDGDSSEEVEAESEEDEQDEIEETEDEESDESRWMPESLDELAEALDTDLDSVVKTIKVKTKVDGQEGEATLSDLVTSYQLKSLLDKRLQANAEERKEFEAIKSQQLQSIQEREQQADALIEGIEQLIVGEYQSIDWQRLKQEDPTEFMLRQQEVQERYATVMAAKQQIEEQRQKEAAKQQEEFKGQWDAYLKSQYEELVNKVPEWRDEKAYNVGMRDIAEYLKSIGASEQEIASIADHRMLVMARKAMLYDQIQSKGKPKAKKMKSKPKFVPPAARKPVQERSQARSKKLFEKAKKTQSEEAWTEVMMDKLGLG